MEALRVQHAGQGGKVAVLTRAGSASRFTGQMEERSQIVEYLQILAGLGQPGPPGLHAARQPIFGAVSAARLKCQCSLAECSYGSS
jgi:hypothetical protein